MRWSMKYVADDWPSSLWLVIERQAALSLMNLLVVRIHQNSYSTHDCRVVRNCRYRNKHCEMVNDAPNRLEHNHGSKVHLYCHHFSWVEMSLRKNVWAMAISECWFHLFDGNALSSLCHPTNPCDLRGANRTHFDWQGCAAAKFLLALLTCIPRRHVSLASLLLRWPCSFYRFCETYVLFFTLIL